MPLGLAEAEGSPDISLPRLVLQLLLSCAAVLADHGLGARQYE